MKSTGAVPGYHAGTRLRLMSLRFRMPELMVEPGERLADIHLRLRQALAVDDKCVRASLMQARLAMTAGAYEAAIRHLQRIETQNVAFLPEAIGPLVECYRAEIERKRAIYP